MPHHVYKLLNEVFVLCYFGKLVYQFSVLFACFVPLNAYLINIKFLEIEALYNVIVNTMKF